MIEEEDSPDGKPMQLMIQYESLHQPTFPLLISLEQKGKRGEEDLLGIVMPRDHFLTLPPHQPQPQHLQRLLQHCTPISSIPCNSRGALTHNTKETRIIIIWTLARSEPSGNVVELFGL